MGQLLGSCVNYANHHLGCRRMYKIFIDRVVGKSILQCQRFISDIGNEPHGLLLRLRNVGFRKTKEENSTATKHRILVAKAGAEQNSAWYRRSHCNCSSETYWLPEFVMVQRLMAAGNCQRQRLTLDVQRVSSQPVQNQTLPKGSAKIQVSSLPKVFLVVFDA
jgi:hypothetical protein